MADINKKLGSLHPFVGFILVFLLLMILYINCRRDVSGAYYDWTKTMQPEQPWIHDYNKTLVIKLFLCGRDGKGEVDKVYLKFDDVLNVLRKLDHITLGIPKIAYLVGWQFNGHDSKYPSWSEVNTHLKRETDATALASLKWLMREAKRYNTIISLHINMIDAFEDSPLWSEYLLKNIVAKDTSGIPIKGEVFNSMQSYQISYAREWDLGYTQKRIDDLIALLPELKEMGTIHIDAFHSMRPSGPDEPISPYLDYTIDEEIQAQRKIFRYWRSKGIDVTCEAGIYWLRRDPFIGLQPMSWHNTESNFLRENWLNKPENFISLPTHLYGYTPMQCEWEIKQDPENLSGLIEQVCLKLVPWYYKRNTDPSKHSNVLIMDDQIVCPVLWMKNTIIAYSKQKSLKNLKFSLPSTWSDVQEVQCLELTLDSLKPLSVIPAVAHKRGRYEVSNVIEIHVEKNQAIIIQPMKGN